MIGKARQATLIGDDAGTDVKPGQQQAQSGSDGVARQDASSTSGGTESRDLPLAQDRHRPTGGHDGLTKATSQAGRVERDPGDVIADANVPQVDASVESRSESSGLGSEAVDGRRGRAQLWVHTDTADGGGFLCIATVAAHRAARSCRRRRCDMYGIVGNATDPLAVGPSLGYAKTMDVRVIGGGLAGCEAAFQLAEAGHRVTLHEQKPVKRTPAQVSDRLAELVCSNSFRSSNVDNAVGLIKEEMRRCGSFIMACAEVARVPAGDALAVDRVVFADTVEARLRAMPNITIVPGEVMAIADDGVPTLVATGPLTGDALAADIARLCGQERLAFYDAIAPIIDADSVITEDIDPDGGAYFKSRWDKGDSADYLNCPMTPAQYDLFYDALRAADTASAHEFEELHYFDGCLPIEVMAERGKDTLRFGPMKPVGLYHPVTNRRAHAVLQLRKEDLAGTSYNIVGCQTRMKQGAQREVFSLGPALREVAFLRYGAIHRNTYVDSPAILDDSGALRGRPNLWFAGQITGVEGYVESTASGLLTAMVMKDVLQGKLSASTVPPTTTALGGLWRHCRGTNRADPHARFQPSNIIWPMMEPLPAEVLRPLPGLDGKKAKKPQKSDRKHLLSERALADLSSWQAIRRLG